MRDTDVLFLAGGRRDQGALGAFYNTTERYPGCRHRQGADVPEVDDIPELRSDRRNDPSADRLPAVVEPRRSAVQWRAAPEPGPAGPAGIVDSPELPDADEPARDDGWVDSRRGKWIDDRDKDARAEPRSPDVPPVGAEPDREGAYRFREPVPVEGVTYLRPGVERRRRRAVPASRTVLRRGVWVTAGIAALVGFGLAAVVVFPGLIGKASTEIPLSTVAPTPVESTFGERRVREDGWAIEIDQPRTARASDHVDLPRGAGRALVFEVVLTNTGAGPRDSAGWTLEAIAGSAVKVLPDGTAPSRTIRPGASLTFPVTVPMPKAATDLQLRAAPSGGAPSLFVGTV